MKKALLIMDVPDDFKKGDGEICPFSLKRKVNGNFVGCECIYNLDKNCTSINCPLKIQEEPQDHYCIECKHGIEGNMSDYCYKHCHNKNGSYGFEPIEMTNKEFVVNEDMFGRYCRIPTDFSKDMHIYKIVNMIESNAWMETPITCKSEMVRHDTMEKILNVIHCGIDETNVIRVALKDVELV